VQFTAEDMAIITGSPSERRRFLDSMLSQLDRHYYAASHRYARILQQRNAVLKRIRDGHGAVEELAFWDESLVREAAVIVDARAMACGTLAPLAASYHRELSGEAMEGLEVEYNPRLAGDERLRLESPASTEDFAAVLTGGMQSMGDESPPASSSPHRDEVEFRINGVSAPPSHRAQVCGDLALRLAEARLLEQDLADPPVLLLDDIVSELDERRRRSVLASIADFDQVWFTATDTHGFDATFLESASVYKVEGGRAVLAT
jgi:DNA replication and repair protein RecF